MSTKKQLIKEVIVVYSAIAAIILIPAVILWSDWHDFRVCMKQGYTIFRCLK